MPNFVKAISPLPYAKYTVGQARNVIISIAIARTWPKDKQPVFFGSETVVGRL